MKPIILSERYNDSEIKQKAIDVREEKKKLRREKEKEEEDE